VAAQPPLQSRSAPAARPLVRQALLKAVTGFALGVLTSAALVLLATAGFPEISEFGIDAGMRLKVALDRWHDIDGGMPLVEQESHEGKDAHGSAFVFLDLDPEGQAAASGCAALAAWRKNPSPADGGGAAAIKPDPAVDTTHCASTSPINRDLLAAVVQTLQERGSRLIVLDIVLSAQDASEVDNKRLHDALESSSKPAPILFAVPAEPVLQEDAEGDVAIRIEPASQRPDPFASLARPSVAIPTPGQPLRRYPKCYWVLPPGGAREPGSHLASLPKLADDLAATPAPPPAAAETGCDTKAPRIIYTLPPITAHEDSGAGSVDGALWAHYRKVFDRCTIAHFWDPDSRCGPVAAKDSVLRDRIVIVGTSNPIRRDWHYTPLGDMVGAQVVANAIRSFQQFPDEKDEAPWHLFFHKLGIVFCCSIVWFFYHLSIRRLERHSHGRKPSRAARVRRGLFKFVAFSSTLTIVIGLTLWMSFHGEGPAPSLDILLGVLAISIEQFVETAERLLAWIEKWVAKGLRLPSEKHR
jgi:CHASE2 domain-containing sensor protein